VGTLVEQPIKSFFQGVSRQPDSFRNPGQVDEAINHQFSVERGGFSSRVPSKHMAMIVNDETEAALHTINRDDNEKYVVVYYNVLGGGQLRVFDALTHAEKTVNYVGDAALYLTSLSPDDISFTSVADYTLVLNRAKVTAKGSTTSPAQQNKAVLFINYATSGSYKVTVNGTTYTGAGSTNGATVAENVASALDTGLDASWTVTRDGVFVFLERVDGAAFTISVEDPYSNQGMKLTYLKLTKSTDLPAKAPNGLVVRVGNDLKSEYYVKAEQLNTGNNDVRWVETVAPGAVINFNPATMPHILVRESDGTFSFKQNTWSNKTVGTEKTVPDPDFVGHAIRDVTFHRNRLGVLGGETTFYSAAGDFFNFWRTSSTEVLDDDPFGMTGTTNEVAILEWAVPFRKAHFATAANVQFEVSGKLLTAKEAAIDVSTKYAVTTKCRPIAIGDSLYIPASNGTDAVLFEYLYDDNSLTNVAVDAAKHAKGFIPATIHDMAGDSTNGNLFCLSTGDRTSIFLYTFYWNGDEKAQQAFGRWVFDGRVRAIGFMSGHLYVLINRADHKLYLEKFSLGNEGYTDYDFPPRLDQTIELTGVYDEEDDKTTWLLPWTPSAATRGVTSNSFGVQSRKMKSLPLTIESGSVVSTRGDWTQALVLFGNVYSQKVRLSRLYVRDSDTAAILNGRANVRHMTFQFENTGFFRVRVTPDQREARVFTFTGRILGSGSNQIAMTPILSSKFRVPIRSNAETVTIEVENDTYIPHTITSAVWVAFFNEITRQE
jgi:hypothetical protein